MELPLWYGQRDARWANIKMGTTTDTIGGYGCLITCIAIMVDAFDYPKNQAKPVDVNTWLTKNGGYTGGDLVIWSAVPRITGSILAQGTAYSGNIAEVANYLNKGNCLCICEVRMNGYMHFVLGYKAKGGDVWVHDPWTNTQKLLSSFGKLYSAHFYAKSMPVIPVPAPTPAPQPPAQPERIPDLPPVVVVPQPPKTETPKPIETPKEIIKDNKETPMLKGYRTYIALAFALVALVAPQFGLPTNISEPLVALCLAVAAFFRAKA